MTAEGVLFVTERLKDEIRDKINSRLETIRNADEYDTWSLAVPEEFEVNDVSRLPGEGESEVRVHRTGEQSNTGIEPDPVATVHFTVEFYVEEVPYGGRKVSARIGDYSIDFNEEELGRLEQSLAVVSPAN